mgnify:CR=1 FL=1
MTVRDRARLVAKTELTAPGRIVSGGEDGSLGGVPASNLVDASNDVDIL